MNDPDMEADLTCWIVTRKLASTAFVVAGVILVAMAHDATARIGKHMYVAMV